jgi:hypothetical protein
MFLWKDTAEREAENRSPDRIGLCCDLPAMRFDDGARYRGTRSPPSTGNRALQTRLQESVFQERTQYVTLHSCGSTQSKLSLCQFRLTANAIAATTNIATATASVLDTGLGRRSFHLVGQIFPDTISRGDMPCTPQFLLYIMANRPKKAGGSGTKPNHRPIAE